MICEERTRRVEFYKREKGACHLKKDYIVCAWFSVWRRTTDGRETRILPQFVTKCVAQYAQYVQWWLAKATMVEAWLAKWWLPKGWLSKRWLSKGWLSKRWLSEGCLVSACAAFYVHAGSTGIVLRNAAKNLVGIVTDNIIEWKHFKFETLLRGILKSFTINELT